MNRTIKIIVSIVLCVWIFAMGLELGAYRERKAINAALAGGETRPVVNTTNPVAPQTSEPIIIPTGEPSTAKPTESTGGNNNSTTAAPTQNTDSTTKDNKPSSSIPTGTDEIVAAFNNAMNATKHTTKNCNAVKNSNVQVTVTDCSVPSLTGMVNSIVSGFTGPETAEYSFVGGKDGDASIYGELPPSGRDVSLQKAGVAKAASEPYGNGGYKLTITLLPETSALGNEPQYHANSVGFLDLEGLGIKGVTFTKADFTYSGATVSICVNKDGLVDKYDCTLPMSGTGEASVKIASGRATLEGSSVESWTFTWL